MDKLVDAVGSILKTKGYHGLNGLSIAKEAKVNNRLIYLYFGSVDNLIETYIKKKDFWTPQTNQQLQEILTNQHKRGKDDIMQLLRNQLNSVLTETELQKILLWEISEPSSILRKISEGREELGEKLFQFVEGEFEKSHLDLRAILAVMISGVYYSALHAVNNGSTFCGIDINQADGEKRFYGALQQIIDMCYEKIN